MNNLKAADNICSKIRAIIEERERAIQYAIDNVKSLGTSQKDADIAEDTANKELAKLNIPIPDKPWEGILAHTFKLQDGLDHYCVLCINRKENRIVSINGPHKNIKLENEYDH